MDLKEALKALTPAVGDGKVIPEHAYVLLKDGLLQVTDGNQWASGRITGSGLRDFCVRFDGLERAMTRDGARISFPARSNNLVVNYQPRGHVTLRGLADRSTYPTSPRPRGEGDIYQLQMSFKKWCGDLLAFTGSNDGQVWTQGIHIGPDFLMAGTGAGIVRTRESISADRFVALPSWAARFITAQDEPPNALTDFGNLAMVQWEDGLTLHTRLLAGDAGEGAVELASNCRIPTVPVPEGLKDAVARLKEHGATTFRAGEGKVVHHSEAVDVEEEIDITGPMKLWNVDTMQKALAHAEFLDLSEEHAYWASEHYVGIVAGMRG